MKHVTEIKKIPVLNVPGITQNLYFKEIQFEGRIISFLGIFYLFI